jgi:hypothetical protein
MVLTLIAIIGLVVATPFIVDAVKEERREQLVIEQSHRANAEFHKQFVAKEQAKADEIAARRIKAIMDANPSWTRRDAEAHMLAEDYDAREAARENYESRKSTEEIQRGCGILYDSTSHKPISDLTVLELQQVRVCEGFGLYH